MQKSLEPLRIDLGISVLEVRVFRDFRGQQIRNKGRELPFHGRYFVSQRKETSNRTSFSVNLGVHKGVDSAVVFLPRKTRKKPNIEFP